MAVRWGWRRLALPLALMALTSASTVRATPAPPLGSLLETVERGAPADATLAMSDAAALALTLPWRLADGPTPRDALLALDARLQPLIAGKGRGAKRPWVPGEAALALGRVLPALEADMVRAATTRRELAERAGVPPRGAIVGPLPGAAPVPLDVSPGGAVLGVFGETQWRPFDGAATPDGLAVGDLLARTGDVHAWLQMDLEVGAALDVTLLAGSNGPLEVQVDGRGVVSSTSLRTPSDWQHAVGLRLERGRHRITVGLGHPTEAPALRLRVIDATGRRPTRLRWVDVDPEARLATSTVVEGPPPLPSLARDEFQRAAFLARFPPAEAAAVRGPEAEGAHATCEAPERCMRIAESLHSVDRGGARIALERAAARQHVPALAALIDLAESEGLMADADRFARTLATVAPDHPSVLGHRALRLLEYEGGAGALEALRSHPAAGVNPRLASLIATLEERRGDPGAAAEAWVRVTALRSGASEPLQMAVFAALKAGKRGTARQASALGRAYRPLALDPWLLEARVDAAVLPIAEVRARLQALTAVHGDDANLHALLGRLALLDDDRAAAVAAFDRALALTPQDRALAEHRRALVADRPAGDGFFETREAIVERGAAIPPAAEGALYLVDRRLVKVFESGLASTFHQYAVRIDAERVAERFSELSFPFTPGEDRVELLEIEVLRGAERLRPEWVSDRKPAGKSGGVYTLTAFRVARLPPLRPGDIVHVQTRQDEVGERNLFGDFFGVFTPLSAPYPKRQVSVVVDAPATRPLFHATAGLPAGAESRTDADGRSRLRFDADSLPAVVVEPDMPGYGDVGAWVNVSTFADWPEMVGWYRRLIGGQLELTAPLKATARELVRGLEGTEARVSAVHGWVIANTRYVGIEFGIHGFKPYHVAEVVRRGYGDCKDKAALLVSMLREVGVPAEFVLVRTRDYGRLADHPATLWAFNHAIAFVPELDLYLDATAERSGLRELPDLDQRAQMLRFDPFSDRPPVFGEIPMQAASDNRVRSTTRWEVQPSGDAKAVLEEVARGSSAARLRHVFHDPSRRVPLLGEMFSNQQAGARVEAASFEGLDTPGTPVSVRASVWMPARAQRAGEGWRIPVSADPGRLLQRWGSLAARTQPLVLRTLEDEFTEDVYTLPVGATVLALPQASVLVTPFGSYALETETTADPRVVVVRTRLRLGASWIPPEDYAAWRAFAADVARLESEAITARW